MISRWSGPRCPHCKIRLSRQFDRSYFAICSANIILLMIIPFVSGNLLRALVAAGGLILIAIVDALTVSLAKA
jgi:hypothetical protein